MAAAIGGCLLGLLSPHRGVYKDGIFFVQWLADWPLLPGEKHVWLYPHLLYLPLAKGFHEVINLVAPVRIDDSLRIFSALCTGAAGPFLVRLFGGFVGIRANAAATALVLLCPSVWFFSGATAKNTIHLAASAFALAMAARPPKGFPTIAFLAGALAVEATHLSGFLLLPAMLALRERAARRGEAPSKPNWFFLGLASAAAIAALAGAALVLHALIPSHSILLEYFDALHPAGQPYLSTAWVELVLRSGVLVPAACVAAIYVWRSEPFVAIAVAVTLPLFVHVIGKSGVEYDGGYNLGAVPVWGAAVAAALGKLPKLPAISLGLAAVAAQGWLGWAQVRPVVERDLYRDTAEAITSLGGRDDAIVLFVRADDVAFDLTQLPNITRLYIGEGVSNAALLDDLNAKKDPYLDDAGARALGRAILDRIALALGSGHRAFVRRELWDPPAGRPRLAALSAEVRAGYRVAGENAALRFVELAKP
jgi:hypothetical protein